jgi:hypothetical protein
MHRSMFATFDVFMQGMWPVRHISPIMGFLISADAGGIGSERWRRGPESRSFFCSYGSLG